MGAPVDETVYEGVTLNLGGGGLALTGHAPIPAVVLEVPRREMYVQAAVQDPQHEFQAVYQLCWIRQSTTKEGPAAGWTLSWSVSGCHAGRRRSVRSPTSQDEQLRAEPRETGAARRVGDGRGMRTLAASRSIGERA